MVSKLLIPLSTFDIWGCTTRGKAQQPQPSKLQQELFKVNWLLAKGITGEVRQQVIIL
jgi:hypothetical protein